MRDGNQDNWEVGYLIAGRWEIRDILRGGMGIVYIVDDRKDHYLRAAKTFKSFLFRSEIALNRFQQEAKICVNLKPHRNIVQAKFFQLVNNIPLLFLEYIPTGNLEQLINKGMLCLEKVLTFAIETCYGMEYVNENDIIAHGDLKPTNILIAKDPITNEDIPKISDFGLSLLIKDAIVDANSGNDTMMLNMKQLHLGDPFRNNVGGTPAYMAPELFNNGPLNVSSDIYSFGVILYQMFTGTLPFLGHNWKEYANYHQKDAPPSIKRMLPINGLIIDEIIQKCLTKYPEKRFRSFTELREQLMIAFKKLTGKNAIRQITDKRFIWLNNKWLEKFERQDKSGETEVMIRKLYEEKTGTTMPEDILHQPIQVPNFLERFRNFKESMDIFFEKQFGVKPPIFAQEVLKGSEWVNKAASYIDLNLPENALACCEKALSIDKHDKRAWNNKGVSYELMGKLIDSFRCFEKAIQIDKNYLHPWLGKGSVLIALCRYHEALDCINFVIERDNNFPRAMSLKGLVLDEMRNYEEALACYNKALALNPSEPGVWCNRANTQGRLNNLTDAIESYKRAVELDPNMVMAWQNMANTYCELKMYEEALDCYCHVIQISPSDPHLYIGQGRILFLTERYEEAFVCYQQAAKLGSPSAWDAIRQCKVKLNR